MKPKTYLRTIFTLALGGTLFAGYLSATKLVSGTCAFNEPCPYFLGYPSCWYGFAMYLAMFVVTAAALWEKLDAARAVKMNVAVSSLGILFAGYFVVQEVLAGAQRYALYLPTCAYGLIFYIAIFLLSLTQLKASRTQGGSVQK